MRTYILLDRSASMTQRWGETISALQKYFEGIPADSKVMLMTFDTERDLVIEERPAGQCHLQKLLKDNRIEPRGMTGLYDAIGHMGSIIDKTAKKRAQIVILTDGEENASHEVNRASAADRIAKWKDKGYDVVFLGADFDAFGDAGKIGVGHDQTLNYASAKSVDVGAMLASRASAYATGTRAANSAWTDSEREWAKS